MPKPTDALIGTGIFAVGAIALYGAMTNVPIFGANGLLAKAISTGTIPVGNPRPKVGSNSAPGPATWIDPFSDNARDIAVADIAKANQGLATQIQTRLHSLGPQSSAADVAAAYTLVVVASAYPSVTSWDVDTLNGWIERTTGQSKAVANGAGGIPL